MSPRQLVDRFDIQDLLVRYCHVLDRRDWPAFEALFTEDANLDYRAFGGPQAGAKTLATYLAAATAGLRGTQHTISTSLIEFEGDDQARARSAAQVMMISGPEAGPDQVLFIGLWYRDRLRRTAQGWRLCERVQERSWMHNLPAAQA